MSAFTDNISDWNWQAGNQPDEALKTAATWPSHAKQQCAAQEAFVDPQLTQLGCFGSLLTDLVQQFQYSRIEYGENTV